MKPLDCEMQAGGAIDLYFYGELDAGARERVDRHLAACGACRRALQDLEEIRAALDARPAVSAPPGDDWSAFMFRLEAATNGPGSRRPGAAPLPLRRPSVPRYAAYLAMAALLVLVTISVIVAARARSTAPAAGQDAVSAGSAPLAQPEPDEAATSLVALGAQHFERSKLVILGLAAKDPTHTSDADWAYERDLATRLLSDTRLYRMAAEDRGLTVMAGVMQDLELVLLQTSLSDRADAATLGRLQRLIRRRDLLEKMNVVATRGL